MSIFRGTNGNDTLIGENVANGGDLLEGFGGNDALSGLAGNDNLHGDAGNDGLSGGEGNDSLDGGPDEANDNDTLDGGNGIDTATYATVQHAMRIDVGSGEASAIDNLQSLDHLVSIENVTGTNFNDILNGESGANGIQGAGGNDTISGGGGNDRLDGSAGNDVLKGDAGNDILIGSAGRDNLTGGGDADAFQYFNASDSGVNLGNCDVITDFQQGVDKLDLHFVDARTSAGNPGDQAFDFVGSNSFPAEGHVRVVFEGGHTVVQLNNSGASIAESEMQLAGHVNLSANDFVL